MSLASCFGWPVTFQGARLFPVAGTYLTHENQPIESKSVTCMAVHGANV